MIVRIPFLITGVVALLLSATGAAPCLANSADDQCDNPIVISDIIVTNSSCGNASGFIILSLVGGNNGYTFDWQPNVSTTNVASGLVAAAYRIRITRINNPACVLDTTVVVNNSNGPNVQVMEVTPANCLNPNGKVVLSPSGFSYAWSNGETGAVNTDLPSGCYFVTATNPGNGCYSVLRVCVPNVNSLQSEFQVLEPAKCGLPTGKGQVNVTGGSGQYSYSFGNSPVVTGLAPGLYVYYVADNVTGCLDTVLAMMPDGPLLGDVVVKPFNIKCTGQGNGNVEFDVVAGSNFKFPYTFALWDESGNIQSPGTLGAGTYYLQIADADSCLLPIDTFTISEPPPFSSTTTVLPFTCNAGGQIILALNGGNGRFIVDWEDLPGFDNPRNRLNLNAGLYKATVYDSLFCAYPIGPLLVPGNCNIPDTLTLIVPANGTDTLCFSPPKGVSPATLTYSIVNQVSLFGTWSLTPAGCVIYQAGPVARFGVDPICVAVKSTTQGLSDTVCVVVNITTQPPQKDSVYFAVQAGNVGSACGFVPPNFSNKVVKLLDGQGLSGTSDAFGEYSIDPLSACITFESYGPTGYNVDEVGVGVCDTVLRQCRVICYFPSVLSPTDCLDGINLPDSLTLVTADCNAGATFCVPIPFEQIFDYAILDNGAAYSGWTPVGCNPGQSLAYIVNLNAGPYQLGEWTVGNQKVAGFFTNAYELLGLMNQADPVPGWTLQRDSIFVGGNPSQTYGPLRIVSAQDQSIEVPATQFNTEKGTILRFTTGLHHLVFRRVQTGCLDTMFVRVICTDCPPIHNYAPGSQDEIVWNIALCAGDTLFCTNIPSQSAGNYSFTDNGQTFSNFSLCGGNTALRLDTGFHQLRIFDNVSFCEYNIKVRITCSGGPADSSLLAVPDVAATFKNASVEIDLLANDLVFGIPGNTNGLQELLLLSNPPNGSVTYDDLLGIVIYTPDEDFCGVDTFSYQITDVEGRRSVARVTVTVVCDKVLVYTGISPNGDNRNDWWRIVGIEQFPRNTVRVFNRWGNLVFEQQGYSNQSPWGGTWNGKVLPDGAYFYLIDLGDGSDVLSGYLHIMR